MFAEIIDGKAIAASLRSEVANGVAELKANAGVTPGLAVVLVGNDPASAVYVKNKARQTAAAGMQSLEHLLPAQTSEAELLQLVQRLNLDINVHGILVQLPLPAHIDAQKVISAIYPSKDVDGFHPINAGRLMIGQRCLVPCTPLGSLKLIRSVRADIQGLNAVIVGRSNIVGKPMSQLLLAENCTVTMAHSKSRSLDEICSKADILIAAAGRPNLVRGDWIKLGSIVIDVGINREIGSDGTAKLVGDVEFESARKRAGFITPVPGGVGPMTIACLLSNTLDAARAIAGIGS